MYTQAEQALIDDPRTMDSVCEHVGSGGSLEDLCETWNKGKDLEGQVRFGRMWGWICGDPERFKRWLESHNLQAQADVVRIESMLRAIALGDIRGLFDDAGRVRPVDQWPRELSLMVAGIDVAELFSGKNDIDERELEGILKKIKLSDRLKAAEMLGKQRGMFVDRKEFTGKLTLQDLVALSNKENPS